MKVQAPSEIAKVQRQEQHHNLRGRELRHHHLDKQSKNVANEFTRSPAGASEKDAAVAVATIVPQTGEEDGAVGAEMHRLGPDETNSTANGADNDDLVGGDDNAESGNHDKGGSAAHWEGVAGNSDNDKDKETKDDNKNSIIKDEKLMQDNGTQTVNRKNGQGEVFNVKNNYKTNNDYDEQDNDYNSDPIDKIKDEKGGGGEEVSKGATANHTGVVDSEEYYKDSNIVEKPMTQNSWTSNKNTTITTKQHVLDNYQSKNDENIQGMEKTDGKSITTTQEDKYDFQHEGGSEEEGGGGGGDDDEYGDDKGNENIRTENEKNNTAMNLNVSNTDATTATAAIHKSAIDSEITLTNMTNKHVDITNNSNNDGGETDIDAVLHDSMKEGESSATTATTATDIAANKDLTMEGEAEAEENLQVLKNTTGSAQQDSSFPTQVDNNTNDLDFSVDDDDDDLTDNAGIVHSDDDQEVNDLEETTTATKAAAVAAYDWKEIYDQKGDSSATYDIDKSSIGLHDFPTTSPSPPYSMKSTSSNGSGIGEGGVGVGEHDVMLGTNGNSFEEFEDELIEEVGQGGSFFAVASIALLGFASCTYIRKVRRRRSWRRGFRQGGASGHGDGVYHFVDSRR